MNVKTCFWCRTLIFIFMKSKRYAFIHLINFQFQNQKFEHFNRLFHSKWLLQHFVVNVFACCEFNNLNWIRQNQQQLRVNCYKKLMNHVNKNFELISINNKTNILSFNFTNESRYMKIKKQNALILIRRFEKFTFFIIFICNFKWFEFERDLFFEISIKNQSNFIARVFQLKFKKLLRDFIEQHVLKQIKIHFYVIEFQKRDFFNAYIFNINYFMNDVISINVDNVVQIQIFKKFVVNDSKHQKRLYDIVKINMIHKTCTIKTQCKNFNDECIKHFSKTIQFESNFNHSFDYSRYRRFEKICVSKTSWNNTLMISYNVYFSLKFNVYINVEICTSIKSIIYLYKYVFKNSNSINVSTIIIRNVNDFVQTNDTILTIDECITYHENKWIDFCETT